MNDTTGADFVSDLNELPDGVVPANTGSIETHRGSDDLSHAARPDAAKEVHDDEQPKKAVSLRDQLSSALKGEDTPPAGQIDGGAARNPDGTFAAKEAPAADLNNPDQSAPAAATGTVQYPQRGVPGLDAATFASLPAETQQHVARTMETLEQEASRYAAYSQIEQVIAPRRQAWALNGMTEGQVINQLFALSDFADKDPDGFIRYFAQQRDLDLEEIAYGVEPVDPIVAGLQQQVQQLNQQLTGLNTQQQQAAHENIVDEIVRFADEKGADGNTPLRPYFAELGNAVLPFIEQAIKQNPNRPRTDILTEAYDAACWANPSVRQKLLAAQQAAAEAKRIKDQTDAAARARTAGVSIPSGTPGDGATKPTGSAGTVRDDIRAAMAAAT